jgi:hypothetical protein
MSCQPNAGKRKRRRLGDGDRGVANSPARYLPSGNQDRVPLSGALIGVSLLEPLSLSLTTFPEASSRP